MMIKIVVSWQKYHVSLIKAKIIPDKNFLFVSLFFKAPMKWAIIACFSLFTLFSDSNFPFVSNNGIKRR